MKKVLFFLLLCMAMCLHSCYDDSALWKSVNDHSARLTKLETLCNQMNSDISTISSLSTSTNYQNAATKVVEGLSYQQLAIENEDAYNTLMAANILAARANIKGKYIKAWNLIGANAL